MRGCTLLCDIGQVLASLASRAPPARVVPGRPQPCIPSSCLLRWQVLSGAPFPFSFGLWPGSRACLLSQQLLSPSAPAGREG